MTNKEKLKKIKELADAMYTKMQNLTTDTSGIRKAMEEYHQFIINEYYKKDLVDGDLGFYLDELSKQFPEVSFAKLSRIAVRVAKWQREQIQSDIEFVRDMWYRNRIQYPSVKDGIKDHAETYSFNIESELFNQLTKEQQELWRKEIEQAYISGGEVGVELARDIRYPENSWSSKVIPTFY